MRKYAKIFSQSMRKTKLVSQKTKFSLESNLSTTRIRISTLVTRIVYSSFVMLVFSGKTLIIQANFPYYQPKLIWKIEVTNYFASFRNQLSAKKRGR